MQHLPGCSLSHCHCDITRYAKAFWITLAVLGVEIIGGYLSNSLALWSDAAHVCVDALAMGTALGTEKIAAKYRKSMNRIRAYGGLVNSTLLVVATIGIAHEATERLLNGSVVHGWFMAVAALVGLAGNVYVGCMLHSGEHHLTQRILSRHICSDAFQSILVVVTSGIIIAKAWNILDPLVSIGIAVIMAYWAIKSVKESLRGLR